MSEPSGQPQTTASPTEQSTTEQTWQNPNGPQPPQGAATSEQETQNPKTPFWKRTYKTTALVLGIVVLASIALSATVSSPIAYHAGRTSEVTNIVLDQARAKSEEYTNVNRKLAEAEADLRNTEKRQLELEDANEEAEATIEKAKSYKIDDLKTESEKLQKEIDEQKKTLETLTGKVETAKKNTIGEGVWQVGKDIDPGTYRATQEVGSRCYWSITNPVTDDIIQNDIPGGGYPEVTVSEGQQLKIANCGTFTKQ
ncbi:hypothetical protein [Bifidobacterium sp. AGR2158]|uniref:hypothetical protein n=1 Tax=Bifidobacterium sp. AGR2158 TaxID=1280675 RepID=UPI000688EC8C|nr:hypothetical protein [Bifidobacterium sp. AGR2158]